jgi:hypothetical protein
LKKNADFAALNRLNMATDPASEAENASRAAPRAWLVALMTLHGVLLVASALWNSVTFDEYAHLPAGVAYWHAGWRGFAIHNLSPPLLRLWAAAPVVVIGRAKAPPVEPFLAQGVRNRHWNYGRAFEQANRDRLSPALRIGRLAMIPISCLGLWIVWRWAGELYHSAGAAFGAAAIYALNPDLIAHGSIVGTDLGTAVAMTAATWLWWRWLRRDRRTAVGLIAAAIAVAVAHLCKFTALLLWPVLVAVGICVLVQNVHRWRRAVAGLLACAIATWLLVNLAYGFGGSFHRLDSYAFTAGSTIALQKTLPGGAPVPFPATFVEGFDVQKAEVDLGVLAFLNGQIYRGSRWDYYPIALALKLPVALLVLLLIAIASIVIPSRWWPRPSLSELPVAAALGIVIVGMIVLSKVNIGVRYILPAYPLAIILCSRIFAIGSWRPRELWPAARTGLLVLLGIETVLACPHYISFINFGFGGQSGRGWQVINDSNFDWGQGLLDLKRWMNEHGAKRVVFAYFGRVEPITYGIEYSPITSPGDESLVAVSSYYLDGLEHRMPTPQGPTDYIGLALRGRASAKGAGRSRRADDFHLPIRRRRRRRARRQSARSNGTMIADKGSWFPPRGFGASHGREASWGQSWEELSDLSG